MPRGDGTGPFGGGKGKGRGLGPCGQGQSQDKNVQGQDLGSPQSQQNQPGRGFFARLGQGWGSMGQGLRRMGQMGGRGKRG